MAADGGAARRASDAARRSATVTFTVDGVDTAAVAAAASEAGVVINTSTANWSMLDMHAKHTESVAGASSHYFKTEDEPD